MKEFSNMVEFERQLAKREIEARTDLTDEDKAKLLRMLNEFISIAWKEFASPGS